MNIPMMLLGVLISATIDSEGVPLHLMIRLPIYTIWLFREIIKANIDTAKIIIFNKSVRNFWPYGDSQKVLFIVISKCTSFFK